MFFNAQQIADSKEFNRAAIAVIVFSGILVGLETSPSFSSEHRSELTTLNLSIAMFFAFELWVRVLGNRRGAKNYFSDAWNLFDTLKSSRHQGLRYP